MTVDEVLHEQFGSSWEAMGTVSMVCSTDTELLREYVTALAQKISSFDYILPVFCDTAGCAQIEDWKRRLGNTIVSAAEKKSLWVPQPIKGDLEDVSLTKFLSSTLEDLLGHLLRLGTHIFLVSEHFEQAVHWNSDMTWGRKLFSREFKVNCSNLPPKSNFSSVMIADRPMVEITGFKPESSSSFANLFGGHTYFLGSDAP